MPSNDANEQLADYLRRRLKHLECCIQEIENKLEDDKRDLCRKVEDGICDKDDLAVGQSMFHLEYVVGNTFRYTMLVGLCSFLEEAVTEITKRLVPDYEARLKAEDRKKYRGNWLAKHCRILYAAAHFDVKPIRFEIQKLHALIALRNCIVHQWGKVAEARNPASVKKAVERMDRTDTGGKSQDGYLLLGAEVLPEAITTAEDIAEHILASKLGTSIT